MGRSMGTSTTGVVALLLTVACTSLPTTNSAAPNLSSSTSSVNGPQVTSAEISAEAVGNYETIEIVVGLDAEYSNPFDHRQVALDATFTAPDGSAFEVPGFWDGDESWRVRFAPSQVGDWEFEIEVSDSTGSSRPSLGSFSVNQSPRHGWLRIGSEVDPSYSPRYLAWSDGTPWYGRGHADLDMALGGPDPGGGGLLAFEEMPESGENMVMWWPSWGNNFAAQDYDQYASAQMSIIDFVLRDAEEHGATVVFTIWTHQYLRTNAHPWGDALWQQNGFSQLTDVAGFFTDPESLAWQENYYRYIIARWAHSPAIAMWQTITEIDGTEAYDRTDPWHEFVNSYFVEHDPYRHPTTATMSGAVDWPRGHEAMDVAQVHLYDFLEHPPLQTAERFASWTRLMWDRVEKPNWVGEYGWRGQQWYPELMHHSNWASLAAGSAMTPIEWNDDSAYGQFDEAMKEDMLRFATFVEETPLVIWDPSPVTISFSDPNVRGWGVAGEEGGVIWAQDFALEEAAMEEIRADQTMRSGVIATVDGLATGSWEVYPYDTWAGIWLEPVTIECAAGEACGLPLPDFERDLALRLERG